MPRAPHTGDWFSLLALTALWGSAFLLNEVALSSFPPAVLVAGRIVIAAAILLLAFRASGSVLPPVGRAWLPMLVLAVFGNVLPFHLIAWAQTQIDSSLAGVLMAVMPLFVLTLAHFFIPGARLTPSRIVGIVSGFVGVAVIIGPIDIGGVRDNGMLLGSVAALAAAFSYSISTIYARRIAHSEPLRLAVGMMLLASVLSLPAAVIEVPSLQVPGVAALVSLLFLGLLSTGFATLLYFRLIQGPGPTFLSFVNYLVPAWAVIAGAVFLDEQLPPSAFAGLGLILAGIAVSELGQRFLRALRFGGMATAFKIRECLSLINTLWNRPRGRKPLSMAGDISTSVVPVTTDCTDTRI